MGNFAENLNLGNRVRPPLFFLAGTKLWWWFRSSRPAPGDAPPRMPPYSHTHIIKGPGLNTHTFYQKKVGIFF